jgi:hypothetical protein
MKTRALSGIAIVILLAINAYGQGDRGTIAGVTRDSSGGAVAGAQISIVHNATNLRLETVSNESGNYRLVSLPIGSYTVRVTAPGFQTHEQQNVQVQVNQTSVVDVDFVVGAVTETVSVSATAVPLISSESAEVGMVVQSKRFLELPLTLGGSIRNPSSFAVLSPGVTPRGTWSKSFSGGGAFQDMTYYDGIALSRGDLSNDGEVNPSVDAIQEFKLITNNYSAEYSHALGGVTSFTMKSGTNQVHGTGFHFIRNEKLDARGFFSPARAPSKQNEWGGVIGGPLVIPKVYNGRDRTFWFFSFDQFYRRGGQLTGLNTLPTARMMQGDFGELPRTIYDPATTRTLPNGTVTRDPFPNNVIPRSRWSDVSVAMLQYHPVAELPGITANSISPILAPSEDHRHSGAKGDHIFSQNHRMSVMFNFTDRPALKSRGGDGGGQIVPVNDPTGSALSGYVRQRVQTRVIHANFDSTLTPSTLNHIGLGYSRFRNPFKSIGAEGGWTQPNGGKLGLTGLQFDLFPLVRFETEGYAWYGARSAIDNRFHTYTVMDTLTLIRGKHTLKFGGEMQHHQDNFRDFTSGGGDFRFRSNATGLPTAFGSTGDAWASFLLGEVHLGQAAFVASRPGGRYTNNGLFVDDTWKVTNRLTMMLGFRWEFIFPHRDPAGRLSYVDLGVPNPEAGNRPGAMVFGGESGFGNRLIDRLWWNPAPRVGFAYMLTNSTVVRGGIGIFNSNYINQGLGLPSFGFATTAEFATGDNGVTSAFNWDNGFPQNFQRPPVSGPSVANGQSVTAVLPSDYKLPRKLQWNLTLERQFGQDLAVSTSYVANKGTYLFEPLQINQVHPNALAIPDSVLRANINSAQARSAGISEPFPGFSQLWGGRATVAQALRPYPQYGDVVLYGSTYGNSTYHSFQAKVDKRYRGGLTGTLAYTWSKFLTDAAQFDSFGGRQNAYQREKSYHSRDLPHILTFSTMYELPFGQGKPWVNGGGTSDRLAGGWKLAAFGAYSSGDRLAVTTNNTLAIFNPGLRPNLVSSDLRSEVTMSDFDPAKHQYLRREAFANPAPGQFGNAPRYLPVRGPMRISESFAVFKDTRISERWSHQFRMEIQNPLNRVVFGNPITNFASNNFGRIVDTAEGPRNIQFGMKLIF